MSKSFRHEEAIAAAEAAIALHTTVLRLDDDGDLGVALWHLLVSLREWGRATGVDFDAQLKLVKEFEAEQ